MATPSAPPNSRVVSLTAEPTPALAGGSEARMESVAGPVARAIPAAIRHIDGTMRPQ